MLQSILLFNDCTTKTIEDLKQNSSSLKEYLHKVQLLDEAFHNFDEMSAKMYFITNDSKRIRILVDDLDKKCK